MRKPTEWGQGRGSVAHRIFPDLGAPGSTHGF